MLPEYFKNICLINKLGLNSYKNAKLLSSILLCALELSLTRIRDRSTFSSIKPKHGKRLFVDLLRTYCKLEIVLRYSNAVQLLQKLKQSHNILWLEWRNYRYFFCILSGLKTLVWNSYYSLHKLDFVSFCFFSFSQLKLQKGGSKRGGVWLTN